MVEEFNDYQLKMNDMIVNKNKVVMSDNCLNCNDSLKKNAKAKLTQLILAKFAPSFVRILL